MLLTFVTAERHIFFDMLFNNLPLESLFKKSVRTHGLRTVKIERKKEREREREREREQEKTGPHKFHDIGAAEIRSIEINSDAWHREPR